MKKLIWTLVILVVVGVFGGRAWWLYQHRDNNQKDTLNIGIVTFRGAFAKMGQDVDNGIILANEQFSKSHPDIKIKLHFEDGKGVAKDAVSAFNKLMMHDIDALIVTGDNMVPVVAPLIAQHKLPAILTIVGSDDFVKHNSPRYMHKNNFSIGKSAGQFADWVVKNNNIKTISVLAQHTVYALEGVKAFSDAAKENGVSVLKEEKFRETDTDVRPVVEKVLADNPDAIFVCGYGKAYINILNRLKESHYKGLILVDKGMLNPETLDGLKEKSGFVFFDVLAPQDKIKAFNEVFEKRFKEVPSSYAQDGYASMAMLLEGISKSDKTPEGINNELKKITTIDTVRGRMDIDSNGVSSLPIFIGKLKADGTYDVLYVKE